MNPLSELYSYADALKLNVFHYPFGETVAVATPDGCIGIDVDKLETRADEAVCLAHEMGHIETGSFYRTDTPACQRKRCEERADRWAINRLVPLPELKAKLQSGASSTWELAECFDVTEAFICKALRYYTDAKGERVS